MTARTPPLSGVPARGAGDLLVALGLLALTLAVRYPGFHRSVIDWDESLYFLMAEAWRAGHLPYTTLCDNKPIGIYAIFAAFQSVFGDSVGSMRLAAVTAVATTAFALYRLRLAIAMIETGKRGGRLPGFVAGALYLLASTRDGGMAANTELFIAPLVCGSLLCALSPRPGRLPVLLSGLCFGLALIVKYVAIFELAAVLLALTMLRPEPRQRVSMAGLFAIGATLPLLGCIGLYAWAGRTEIFVTSSLLANIRRLDMPFPSELARQAFHDHAAALLLPYCAVALLLIPLLRAALTQQQAGERRRDGLIAAVLLLWVAGAMVGTASAKSFYPHYFLQPLPALCLTAVWIAGRTLPYRGVTGMAMTVALLVQPAAGARDAIAETWDPVRLDAPGVGWLRDEPARIAADLRPALAGLSGTPLYVVDYQPILYHLTAAPTPTRFAFPSFIIGRFLSRVVAVDPRAEFAAIAAQHPHFIVRARDRHPSVERDNLEVYVALAALLDTEYRVWKTYPNAVVYRRRDDP